MKILGLMSGTSLDGIDTRTLPGIFWPLEARPTPRTSGIGSIGGSPPGGQGIWPSCIPGWVSVSQERYPAFCEPGGSLLTPSMLSVPMGRRSGMSRRRPELEGPPSSLDAQRRWPNARGSGSSATSAPVTWRQVATERRWSHGPIVFSSLHRRRRGPSRTWVEWGM